MKNPVKTFELQVRSWIQKHALLPKGSKVLAAVSGGMDSMCLLYLLHKWSKQHHWDLKIATFDHGLRSDSKKDVSFVETYAKKMGLECVIGEGDVLAYQKKHHTSLEESCRILRYEFLKGVDTNAKIALAHHLDDQIETFFVQLLKGSGLGGLSGMVLTDGYLVRPFLNISKKQIENYVKVKKIPYRKDKTNRDLRFLRNKVRHRLIPYLEKNFEMNFKKSLSRLMLILKDEHALLEKMTQDQTMVQVDPKGFVMDVLQFSGLEKGLQRRVIKNILDKMSQQRNYSSLHVERVCELFSDESSNSVLMMPEKIQVQKMKNLVFFRQVGC